MMQSAMVPLDSLRTPERQAARQWRALMLCHSMEMSCERPLKTAK